MVNEPGFAHGRGPQELESRDFYYDVIPIASMVNDIKLIKWLMNLDSPMAGDRKN